MYRYVYYSVYDQSGRLLRHAGSHPLHTKPAARQCSLRRTSQSRSSYRPSRWYWERTGVLDGRSCQAQVWSQAEMRIDIGWSPERPVFLLGCDLKLADHASRLGWSPSPSPRQTWSSWAGLGHSDKNLGGGPGRGQRVLKWDSKLAVDSHFGVDEIHSWRVTCDPRVTIWRRTLLLTMPMNHCE